MGLGSTPALPLNPSARALLFVSCRPASSAEVATARSDWVGFHLPAPLAQLSLLRLLVVCFCAPAVAGLNRCWGRVMGGGYGVCRETERPVRAHKLWLTNLSNG